LRNNATDTERLLWKHLSKRQLGGAKLSRQMPVGPYVCDFMCRERMLIIEVDGGQHAERAYKDAARTRFLEQQGFAVIRFWNNEVLENIEGVLITIKDALQNRTSRFSPSPLPRAGGEEPRSGEGVGLSGEGHAHPQPPPASGRGLS